MESQLDADNWWNQKSRMGRWRTMKHVSFCYDLGGQILFSIVDALGWLHKERLKRLAVYIFSKMRSSTVHLISHLSSWRHQWRYIILSRYTVEMRNRFAFPCDPPIHCPRKCCSSSQRTSWHTVLVFSNILLKIMRSFLVTLKILLTHGSVNYVFSILPSLLPGMSKDFLRLTRLPFLWLTRWDVSVTTLRITLMLNVKKIENFVADLKMI